MIIWLIGPSGAGKSTAGRHLAASLGARFVDADEAVETRAHSTVERIFASRGEKAFRELERHAIEEIADANEPTVVALGAGAIVDTAIRRMVCATGVRAYLAVEPATAIARLRGDRTRPMLDMDDAESSWLSLLQKRVDAYRDAEIVVDANRAVDAVVADIQRALGQLDIPTWQVDATIDGEETSIASYRSVLHLFRQARALSGEHRFIVVTDRRVASEYGNLLGNREHGFGSFVVIDAGEQAKSFASAEQLISQFAAAGLTRDDVVVAFGGGVVTDLAGFCASVYMRGIESIYIPTTLLAQVDAAIGGKTALDAAGIRNLVGTLRQPRHVLLSTSILGTLSARELRSGFVEALKMGLANSEALAAAVDVAAADVLEGIVPSNIDDIVRLAVDVKLGVVRRDAADNNERLSLNFGHTFGHALESAEPGRHAHGEAVAFGILAATVAASDLGIIGESRFEHIVDRVTPFARRVGVDHDVDAIVDAMSMDKKRTGAGLRLVLPTETSGVSILSTTDRALLVTAVQQALDMITVAAT